MSLLYPVSGCIGKRLRGEVQINYKPSPPCSDCRYYPKLGHKERCWLNVDSVASYCSNYEDLSAGERVKRLLEENRR